VAAVKVEMEAEAEGLAHRFGVVVGLTDQVDRAVAGQELLVLLSLNIKANQCQFRSSYRHLITRFIKAPFQHLM
jgi:hypothetical protein